MEDPVKRVWNGVEVTERMYSALWQVAEFGDFPVGRLKMAVVPRESVTPAHDAVDRCLEADLLAVNHEPTDGGSDVAVLTDRGERYLNDELGWRDVEKPEALKHD